MSQNLPDQLYLHSQVSVTTMGQQWAGAPQTTTAALLKAASGHQMWSSSPFRAWNSLGFGPVQRRMLGLTCHLLSNMDRTKTSPPQRGGGNLMPMLRMFSQGISAAQSLGQLEGVWVLGGQREWVRPQKSCTHLQQHLAALEKSSGIFLSEGLCPWRKGWGYPFWNIKPGCGHTSLKSALTHSNKTSPQMHQDKGCNGEREGRSPPVDALTWSLERMYFLGPKWDLL